MPKCTLCNKNKKLIDAHIFPDFLYKYIYENNHEVQLLSFDKSILVDDKNVNSKTIFSGEYDNNILCSSCDNEIIGSYETYGSQILKRIYEYFGLVELWPKKKIISRGSYYKVKARNAYYKISEKLFFKNRCCFTEFTKIDYRRFKLFILSILFKAIVSKREFSKNINLPHLVNDLRHIIYNGINLHELIYPIQILSYIHHKNIPTGGIYQPILSIVPNCSYVSFIIPGLLIRIIIDEIIDLKGRYSKLILKENGSIKVIRISENEIGRFFHDYKFFRI